MIPDFVLGAFQKEINNIHWAFLKNVAKRHNIDEDKLKTDFEKELKISIDIDSSTTLLLRKKYKPADPEKRCQARIYRVQDHDFTQCCRKKMNEDVSFCKTHQKQYENDGLKYGKICEPLSKDVKVVQKRVTKVY